ncbi:MBL fold metallo-hydrolase [Glaesserella sp.]|uniref:MBL fold metallo-hydrolase n=1 Tax=Glaesserella sp. TaxID=2094731 RepID=UPI0035A19992
MILLIMLGSFTYWLYPDNYPLYPESDHYSVQQQAFFNKVPDGEIDSAKLRRALWEMIVDAEKFAPPSELPSVKPDFSAFLAPSEKIKLIWFGHSTFLARIGSKTVFVDPVFAEYASPIPIMMKRFQAPPSTLDELPPVDLIIYSHNHYDHLDEDVVRYFALQKTRFIVPLGMGVLLQKWGVSADRIQELDWWQSLNLGDFELFAVPARHNTARGLFDRNKTLWAGYVFKTSTEQIYYSGDTSWGDGSQFEEIAERFGGFDLALIENGQYNLTWIDNHLMPKQTADVAKRVNTKRFMPVHWGAYPLALHPWNEPVLQSVPLVEQYGIKVVSPLLGQVFDKESNTRYWWLEVK